MWKKSSKWLLINAVLLGRSYNSLIRIPRWLAMHPVRKGEQNAQAPGQTWGKLAFNFCISSTAMGCSCPRSLPLLPFSMSAMPHIPVKGLVIRTNTELLWDAHILVGHVLCKFEASFFLRVFSICKKGLHLFLKGDYKHCQDTKLQRQN